MTLRFGAPWSTPLTAISALLVGVTVVAVVLKAPIAVALLGATVALAGAFAVLGYVVEPGALVIRRPGWETRLDLTTLDSVTVDPDAMKAALRTFGIGGPFAFVGRYRSRAVGPFSAYATDPRRCVVLRWPDRTVVVTPDDPDSFATAVEAAAERGAL